MDLFDLPDDITALTDEQLAAFVEATQAAIDDVAADPTKFVTADVPLAELFAATKEAAELVKAAREELASREPEAPVAEPAAEAFAELAAEARGETNELEWEPEVEPVAVEAAAASEPEPEPEPEPVEEPEPDDPVTAGGEGGRKPVQLPRPARSRQSRPEPARELVPLTASAGADNLPLGYEFPSEPDDEFPDHTRGEIEMARAMIRKHGQLGQSAAGEQQKVTIASARWSDLYPDERRTTNNEEQDRELVASALSQRVIRQEFERRRDKALTASGGLCAPVTPYYGLAFVSSAERPVRAALAAFNADRGGLRYARPATLASITTGVGARSAADDAAGGTFARKTCQIVDCPPFVETDVEILYHCLQFGNLGARTFPERVAQWNNLVLAAHARLAESLLLSQIDADSTKVNAGDLGLGASATLFSHILTASQALRSRHRMDPETVLRIMLPFWAPSLIVSDVIRGQFQRFETDEERVVALLRSFNIEPSFYIDSANGRFQEYGPQADNTTLQPFPETITWYLYPEGSFLYLDGGTLELGIVRDSVLNATNDFQIFGETFENVAFIGVESLAVTTYTCDSGTVSLPHAVACPIGNLVNS